MTQRSDLNALPSAKRTTLVNLMLGFINDAVVWQHNPNNPNATVHHMGEHAFITHRSFIADLEDYLAAHGGAEFVPLPSWNPANPIPAEFNVVKAHDDGSPRLPLVNLNPGLPKPANLNFPAVCTLTTSGDVLWDTYVDGWHGSVHIAVGGTMGDITTAPAAPVFFCWHSFLDDIYEDWLLCRWSGWEDLGGIITSGVGVSSWASGRLDCFVKGQDNHMWHKWFNGSWNGWEDLGGVIDDTPSAVSWGPNRIDCFARGMNNHMWHKWFDGQWHGWEDLGGIITSSVGVCSWGSGRLDCFAKGQDNHMWHKWFNGSWSGWEDLGGILDDAPAAVSGGANRIDCYVRGMNNHMWHKQFDGQWHGWEDLGGIITEGPAAAAWSVTRNDTFVKGSDNGVWYKWRDRAVVHGHEGVWSRWQALGGVIDDQPGAVSWGPGRIDLFARGMNNHMFHKWRS